MDPNAERDHAEEAANQRAADVERWTEAAADALNHRPIPVGPFDEAPVGELASHLGVSHPRHMTPAAAGWLAEVLDAAGVEMWAQDRRVVEWLAGWEPETTQVIAGWVARAGGRRG